MFVIPAIDIIQGKCVRLTKGDYATQKVYDEDPLGMAQRFEDHGLRKLHLVDLDGAKSQRVVNWNVLYKIASNTGLEIDFSGGIKSDDDIRVVLESGARQAGIGSTAVRDKELFLSWIHRYGPECVLLGADVKDGKIAISGWEEDTDLDLIDFVREYEAEGVRYITCTDISRDGMLLGSALDLYKTLCDTFPEIRWIASGGVTSMRELDDLRDMGCYGAIVGKAIYENKISLRDLEIFQNAG